MQAQSWEHEFIPMVVIVLTLLTIVVMKASVGGVVECF